MTFTALIYAEDDHPDDPASTSKQAVVTVLPFVDDGPPNNKPIADSQTVTTIVDTPITIILTGSDIDGDELSFNVANDPSNGSLEPGRAADTNTHIYTPNPDFVGEDTFFFTVDDGVAASDVAQVTIIIEEDDGENQPPTARIEVSAQTLPSDGGEVEFTLYYSDPDSDQLTYLFYCNINPGLPETLPEGDQGGTLYSVTPGEQNLKKTCTYFSNLGVLDHNYLAWFEVIDSGGEADSKTQVITVKGQTLDENQPPFADADFYSVIKGETLVVPAPGVLIGDTDLDGPDPLTAILKSDISPTQSGTLAFQSDGSFNFFSSGSFEGVAKFTYTAFDGQDESAETAVTITVDPIDGSGPPSVEIRGRLSTEEVGFGRKVVEANRGNQVIIESYPTGGAHISSCPSSGFETIKAYLDGVLIDQLPSDSFFGRRDVNCRDGGLGVNFAFSDTVETGDFQFLSSHTYRLKGCTSGGCDSSQVTINITDKVADNQPPTLSIPNFEAEVDTLFSQDVSIYANDDDDEDVLTFELTKAPGLFDTATLTKAGNLSWAVPRAAIDDVYNVEITVDDGHDHRVSDSFKVTVIKGDGENNPPNPPSDLSPADGETGISLTPTFSFLANGDPDDDQIVAYDVFGWKLNNLDDDEDDVYLGLCRVAELDSGIGRDGGHPLSITADDCLPGVIGDKLETDSWYQWTAAAYDGISTVTEVAPVFKTGDGTGGSNTAPEAVDDSYSVVKNNTLSVDPRGVLENDTDVNGDTLTARLETDVTSGVLTLNDDGSFTYKPNTDFVGTDVFTYKAFDGQDQSDEAAEVTIVVSEPDPDGDCPDCGGGDLICTPTNLGCGAGPCTADEFHFTYSGLACTGLEPECVFDTTCTGSVPGGSCAYRCGDAGAEPIPGRESDFGLCEPWQKLCEEETAPTE